MLDAFEKIQLDLDSPPLSNLHALDYLSEGLHALASLVKRREVAFATELPGGPPALAFSPSSFGGVVECAFHWFAVSAVNYARLIALLQVMQMEGWSAGDLPPNKKRVSAHCRAYVLRVLPDVKRWRDKVGAHFAATDPVVEDNLGTLQQSLMTQLVYMHPRLYVAQMKWSTGGQTSNLPGWSVTEVYEQLVPRWWPELIPEG